MNPLFARLIGGLWVVWFVYWWAVARNVKTTRWQESRVSQLLYRIPVMITALLLLMTDELPGFLRRRFVPDRFGILIAATALVAAGLAFAVWARRHLGRNWSATVTVKEGHSLVRTGPYRLVRHPIYTGVLAALVGTALAIGELRGLVAVAFAFVSFARKTSVEEARMREEFPEYEAYRAGTAKLIPFIY